MVQRTSSGQAKLEEFERAVYCRKKEDRITENDAAVRALHQCLVTLREGAGFEGHGAANTMLLTRMASAITALWFDPGFNLSQDGLNLIYSEKVVIDTVFRASAYGGTDHIFGLMPDDEENATKYLALFSPNSRLAFNLEAVFRENPQATIGLYLSLIGYGQILTEWGHERREKLLKLAHIFEGVDLPGGLWNTLCGAYMHCSYAEGPHKHDCKRVFHKVLGSVMDKAGLEPVGPLVRKDKPKLLCIFEWWWSKHAMYRSYAHSIRQLRQRFHLIGSCAGKNTDDEAKSLFDEWIEIDADNMNVPDVARKISGVKADIIYYPSIGMGVWVIAMASARLAPIQVMGYGHPATSNSPAMDYGIIESDCYTPGAFAERIITLPPNTVRPTAFQKIDTIHQPRKADVVKIAVSAMQVKVTYPFVQALKEVQKRSKKKIELWFFSAAYGIGLYSLASDLANQLQNVWVQEQQVYADYMASMAACDLALFSFPFGGANSAYDALTIGLPMVSLKGTQPHSMSDASIQARAGLPAEYTVDCVEDYIRRIVELVENDDKRAEFAAKVRAVDIENRFYQPDESGAFLKAFESIYEENLLKQAA